MFISSNKQFVYTLDNLSIIVNVISNVIYRYKTGNNNGGYFAKWTEKIIGDASFRLTFLYP